MKPVHITGRGLACSLGLDAPSCIAALRSCDPAAAGMTEHRTLPGGMGGEFPYYAIPYAQADWHERAHHLVTRVAEEAGADDARDGILFLATASFDIGSAESGASRPDFSVYPAFASRVSGWLNWRGPVYTISTACTSSLNALLAAHAMLSTGRATDALVLGIELENRLTLGGFASLQLLSRTSCKPFGLGRDGLVLGEAVAALRLSTRAASPWRLLGGANVVDGRQPTGASLAALADMYRRALVASGVSADDIDLVKVQAAGSPGNDAAEAAGLRAAFPRMPALVSLKAAIGHTMGASGAAEIALLLSCLEQAARPCCPDALDPELGVDLLSPPGAGQRILATILGFGGSHASVVLERT
jgi:3-oxoacyl-[acyl-carrier-protein] synthase-1